MAEDTTKDDPVEDEASEPSEQPPSSEPTEAGTPSEAGPPSEASEPTTKEAPPATSTAVSEASAPSGEEPEASEGLDPQLIVLCVLLWLGALGLFLFKWDGLKADWYLGNIMESINLRGDFDGEAMDALAEMGPDVVPHLDGEIAGANYNRDELYRIAVVKILERIDGPAALETLFKAASDVDPRVRANVYLSLRKRVDRLPDEREPVISLLTQVVGVEPEPVARAYSVQMLSELDGLDQINTLVASWPFIKALREARDEADLHVVLRKSCLDALRTLTGVDEETLPYDPAAPVEARDAAARAWETWFVAQGGEVPAGESYEEWEAALAEDEDSGQAEEGDGSGAAQEGDAGPPEQRSE